ncbi:restriction endonuclease subunit S [Amycolatopsis eburnea]|uniref:Restriction endonuclease subunit S n=1 Tax=Amycolatopsis eburnea TaxID=2267691 RepID=A0A427T2D9_9PSEU|nr:restriction endonuclease subunit S [Amycolatopsis eburnea]RSD13129.1 restriction endonuclease subunit S [Amycolatopsis eburnea]
MTKTVPLRRLVDVIDCAHVTAKFVDDDRRFPVASIRECQGPYVDLSDCNYTTQEFFDHLRAGDRAPRVGDLLFVRNVSVGLVSEVAPGVPEFAIGQETVLLRRTSDVDPTFLRYALVGAEAVHAIESAMIGSTFRRINVSAIRALPVMLPSPEKQRAIAGYLDRETARIDTLIEEQQRLIGLLRERRNAVVDRALSHGLEAELVQTGDPWLPVLPVGWLAVATKRLLSFGPSNGISPEASSVGDLRTLSLGAVRDGRVSMGPNVTKFVDRASVPRLNDLRLRAGDVLLVRGNGNVNLVGRAGLVGSEFDDKEYIYPDLLIRLRVGASMLPEFFVWAFNSAATRAQIGTRARTAVGTYKVAASDVRAIVLPLPPLSEQARIVAYLDEQTAKIDSLIAETERFIELSRERRSALITAAVTGQIDVRERV